MLEETKATLDDLRTRLTVANIQIARAHIDRAKLDAHLKYWQAEAQRLHEQLAAREAEAE